MSTDLPTLPPITPGRWRHYKGLDYEVLGVVRHSETLEPLVLYRPLYNDSGMWVRPYAMFLESVEVEGRLRPRFERVLTSSVEPPEGMEGIRIRIQDPPDEALLSVVDQGLGAFNEAAAPLHEVQPLACSAEVEGHGVVGGAVGRLWSGCVELQQLWISESLRGRGLGRQLLKAFEQLAIQRGAQSVFLDTFSFQAPQFYERQGYLCESTNLHYPYGIRKHRYIKLLS